MFIHYASLLLLAFAVSLDSFSVGMAYGLRQLRIPLYSIAVIALCSFTMIFVATGVAHGLLSTFSVRAAEQLGGVILIGLGIWAFCQVLKKNGQMPNHEEEQTPQKKIWRLEIKKLGIIVQVLRRPMAADMDRSGVISGREAFVLGLALSLDAFGAGVGAFLVGYPPLLTAVSIGMMSSLFLYLGMTSARALSRVNWLSRFVYLPAFVLMIIGLWKIF